MKQPTPRRGNTQKNRVGQALPDNALAKGHSPFLEKGNNPSYCQVKPDLHKLIAYRLGVSPTGATSELWNNCHKVGNLSGYHPTYEEALNKDSFRAPLRCGFTLIELLVVVLIIGILAAVALPQYQKAVLKSRFTQWVTYVDSVDKALDVWLLTNGMPDHTVYFTGEEPEGTLDVDLPCTEVKGTYCYTDLARFVAGCGDGNCWIDMGTNYDDYKGPFPSGSSIWTGKYTDGSFHGKRILRKVPTDPAFRKIVCEWGATHWGKNRMHEEVITSCAEVGI